VYASVVHLNVKAIPLYGDWLATQPATG